ncbi:radical SAM protein [bacterium]|nr:radical SAM protein [bacterium]
MHDDIYRLDEYFQNHSDLHLPIPPEGMRWSARVWVSDLGEWIALFRPMNLGLYYIAKASLTTASSVTFPWNSLHKERLIRPEVTDIDQRDHRALSQRAQSGTFRFLCILPTTSCTLRCAYCHQQPGPGRERTMTLSEIDAGLEKCAALCTDTSQPVDILIYGGEPLNAFHITEAIIAKTRNGGNLFKQPVRLSFTTSGVGMTATQAQILAEADAFVILSVDGPPEINDNVRVSSEIQSSFEAAMQAYRLLKENGCRLGLSVTIGRHNVASLRSAVADLLGYFKINDIGLNAFLHWKGDRPNPYQVDVEDAFESYIEAFEVTREAGVFAEQPFRRIKPFARRIPLVKDCSSPAERLVLAPGGVMGFCDSCYPDQQYFYRYSDFPKSSEPDHRLWASLSAPDMPECSICPVMTVCGGACRYDAFKASGKLDGVDPERCRFERAFLNWIIQDLFNRLDVGQKAYYLPSDEERFKLFGNVQMKPEDQPFTAGSYSL